ncbi:MAG: hypothetical protein KGL54_13935 [Sphingomonadales bacterium]|nr:hypothetical protein [Sphingomonadales bacterium]
MDVKGIAIDILVALMVPFLTALAGQLLIWINQWLKKRGLDLSAEQQAKLEALAQKAILAAEEWARGLAKQGSAPSSAAKLNAALAIVREALPGASEAALAAAVNSGLASLRVAAPAAVGEPVADPR